MEGQWGDIIDIVNEPQLEQAEVAYNLPNINLQFNETNRINQVKTSGNSSSCTILMRHFKWLNVKFSYQVRFRFFT